MDSLEQLESLNNNWFFWLGFLASLLLLHLIIQWGLGLLGRRTSPTRQVWHNALLQALSAPLRTLVWLFGLSLMVNILDVQERWGKFYEWVAPTRNLFIILLLSWFLLRFVKTVDQNIKLRAASENNSIDPTAADAIGKLSFASIFILTLLAILQNFGVSIASLLAFGGVAGIAVGFAAQSLVANLLGGLTVFATRIFSIGDYIILPGTPLAGKVERIGWRSTKAVDSDCRPFYIPNAIFNTSTVINQSRMKQRRIMEYIALRPEDAPRVEAIVQQGLKQLQLREDIDQNTLVLRLDTLGENTLKLLLVANCSNDYATYMQVKEQLLLTLTRIISEQGATLASSSRNGQSKT